ncbi:MAG: multicopper oxidase [Methylococcaceae bacterium]|nr:multicopper oxidase [Methylococcaceae bacterium]
MKNFKLTPLAASGIMGLSLVASMASAVPVPGGSLDPLSITKFTQPLIIPPEMPATNVITDPVTGAILRKEYRIGERQFDQQILPAGFPTTTVWSYGPADSPWVTSGQPVGFNYPAYTIEALSFVPTQVTWVNQLTDGPNGPFLPHLLTEAVDQTLHWANPGQAPCADGTSRTDCKGTTDVPYYGPVPMSTHVHGAHVQPDSDGYPESWWLPDASNIPAGYVTRGNKYLQAPGSANVQGEANFVYPNSQRAATNWYHDHSLGMTRQNVYAGPAGFFLIRDKTEQGQQLPSPAPSTALDAQLAIDATLINAKIAKKQAKIVKLQAKYQKTVLAGEPDAELLIKIPALEAQIAALQFQLATPYREIPIVVQDRSFNADGSLFYPTDRAFFEGLAASQLQLPFDGQGNVAAGQFPNNVNGEFPGFLSDIAPIWNPEAFFNTNVVNGRVWPFLDVQPERYRLRLLNGANSRFYNFSLRVVNADGTLGAEVPFYQIGSDGGLLLNPVEVLTGFKTPVLGALPLIKTAADSPDEALLMAPAERADVIVDFTGMLPGTKIRMINTAPDAPFGGFPDVPADFSTTGQVMEFHVGIQTNQDQSVPVTGWTVQDNLLAEFPVLTSVLTRQVSLNEEESLNLCVDTDAFGGWLSDVNGDVSGWMPCNFVTAASFVPFAPKAALIGTQVAAPGTMGVGTPLLWMDNMTELPQLGTTEMWEIFNNTVDAHPVHEHLVQYQIINREDPVTGIITPPAATEMGWKDTVIAYPGQITRIIATYDRAGLYVFHCHILEHEDNEMMRPFCVIDPLNPDCNGAP